MMRDIGGYNKQMEHHKVAVRLFLTRVISNHQSTPADSEGHILRKSRSA